MNKNRLQFEQSLYLQQHAANPIDWFPWSEEAFEKAKKEDKLLFISIGYSSCHWCHVMEKEVFEKEDVAEVINRHFVCIKVDREERPDVDNVYMSAVQLMNQNGGWPLNCFALADGRPIFGGTYFPKPHFINILHTLVELKEKDPQKMLEYASSLEDGLHAIHQVANNENVAFESEKLHDLVVRWSAMFDWKEGGNKRAPKFPMPNNYKFLLQYGRYFGEEAVVDFTHFTLEQIIRGGIYDQVEGGLMRYSVDMFWKEPHFEKMLYDNGQFLSVLAQAYIDAPNQDYESVLKQTFHWLESKMKTDDNLFKSSIDADANGEEGSFYVWKKEELSTLLKTNFEFAKEVYQINENGLWKNGNYILLRDRSFEKLAKKFDLSLEDFIYKLNQVNQLLQEEREKRIAPTIDRKVIFSWNCMLAIGLIDMSLALKDDTYFNTALNIVNRLENNYQKDFKIYRIVDTSNKIKGCLDDYVYYVQLCIKFHQYTLDKEWLTKAVQGIESIESNFDKQAELYLYASKDPLLITSSLETEDNVIPASNSALANCYWDLGVLLAKEEWLNQAKKMLQCVYEGMENYGSGYSNWAILLHKILKGDLLVTYLDSVNQDEHHEQLRKLHDRTLFKLDENHQVANSFEICHNQSCLLPIEGYENIYNRVLAV
jgi:hypothetical protein